MENKNPFQAYLRVSLRENLIKKDLKKLWFSLKITITGIINQTISER